MLADQWTARPERRWQSVTPRPPGRTDSRTFASNSRVESLPPHAPGGSSPTATHAALGHQPPAPGHLAAKTLPDTRPRRTDHRTRTPTARRRRATAMRRSRPSRASDPRRDRLTVRTDTTQFAADERRIRADMTVSRPSSTPSLIGSRNIGPAPPDGTSCSNDRAVCGSRASASGAIVEKRLTPLQGRHSETHLHQRRGRLREPGT